MNRVDYTPIPSLESLQKRVAELLNEKRLDAYTLQDLGAELSDARRRIAELEAEVAEQNETIRNYMKNEAELESERATLIDQLAESEAKRAEQADLLARAGDITWRAYLHIEAAHTDKLVWRDWLAAYQRTKGSDNG